MKKRISNKLVYLLVLILAVTTISGCASKVSAGTKDIELESAFGEALENTALPAGAEVNSENIEISADGEVDVDLTALSSILVYAEVYNMMMLPEEYVGKTVKLRGPYYAFYYDATDLYYHYVIIEDATACCEQGIEIRLDGDYSYPDDFPADDTVIEVTGTFEMYDELGYTYYCIQSDSYTVVE